MQQFFLRTGCLFLWLLLRVPPLSVRDLQGSVCVLQNLTDEDTVSSCPFTTRSPCVFASLSMWFASQAWFILVCALSLWWLRVMVTLKVYVCCSSILSSSDTLMKGHHAKA